tara:strand:- start:2815 stop:2976 length:162 start_codon:yes stop_codon:yes gene_type:complete
MVMNKIIVCASCGAEDKWEGFEDVYRVTGKEGEAPELVTIAACECGYQQEVIM